MRSGYRTILNIVTALVFLASILGSAVIVTPAHATTNFLVDTAADTVAPDGFCSLREAIQAAETDMAVNECPAGSGADEIQFAGSYTITLAGPFSITTPITIIGLTPATSIIEASACNPNTLPGGCTPAAYGNIFLVTPAGNLILRNLTVRHGNGGGPAVSGGAIRNEGVLSLEFAVISDNRANLGGGLYGTLGSWTQTLNTTFSSNVASLGGGAGGGIYLDVAAGAQILQTTFDGNTSGGVGGAIAQTGAALTIGNSTFFNNSAAMLGGGIYNGTTMQVNNSTFSANLAMPGGGGGIYNQGMLQFANVILADNPAGLEDCYNAAGPAGILMPSFPNIIELDGPPPFGCGLPAIPGDPGLLPLANNGGLTRTMAITPASIAFNTGNVAICNNVGGIDQRGLTRAGPICDIGAYEFHFQPANDNFASAAVISALPSVSTVNTVGATSEPTDPSSCFSGTGYQSVWYSFTPASNLDVTANTLGSDYDTVLVAWLPGPTGMLAVACNDDAGGALGRKSRVRFDALAGTTYYIEVLSYLYQGGNLQLNVVNTRESGDYDAGGHTDPAVFERATGNWFAAGISGGFYMPALGFGNDANYIPVPGDYDGDGMADAAVFQRATGNWFVVGSTAGFFTPALGFGNDTSYIPVPGDYDGDLKTDAAVYEIATGNWFVVSSYDGSLLMPALGFGNANFYPVPGYWDGDGRMDPAVYEKTTGNWFAVASMGSALIVPALNFGGPAYIPVQGDYDGDGYTDAAVFEKATGNWFAIGSTQGFVVPALGFGNDASYIPVQGDYDVDHKTDAAVFERATGNWFVVGSTSGFFAPALNFGNDTSYIPVSSPPN